MTDTPHVTTVDAYIESFAEPTRTVLEQIRQAIHRAAPDVVETISYAMPTFDRNGKHLVFVAGWKRHISLYPIPAGDSALQHDIAPYRKARSTLQFPLAKPVPYDLVARIVSFLVAES